MHRREVLVTLPAALLPFAEPRRVLDHGFIQLLDVMGDDLAVEEAARVSYAGGTRQVNETRGLIRYLMRHYHSTPFEMCEIKFRVKLPIVVERQWIRHRMANTNETSARYSELPEEFYIPEPEQVCFQDTKNKQGRAGPLPPDDANAFRANLIRDGRVVFEGYRASLADGIARETARFGLPLGTYTKKIWKMNLKN